MADICGRYWNTVNGEIQCHVCPRQCLLKEGQRGFCFVRQNRGGQLILTTYGQCVSLAIDPIEKKPLNHFYPGSSVLSLGTVGCNMSCAFCQNCDISQSKNSDFPTVSASPERITKEAVKNRCESVAFTYNEPTIFLEYAIDTAVLCHEHAIKTVAVTNGYIQGEARADFFHVMDAVNVDLKSMSDDFYKRFCQARLQPVLETLLYLKHETHCWLEITYLIIPGYNDSAQDIQQAVDWILTELGPDVPLHFSAFHPAFQFIHIERTSLDTLRKARMLALDAGLFYVYTGNVVYAPGELTLCHHCGALLIERNRYHLEKYRLDETLCPDCGLICHGIFK